jgi:hypothetical protein
VRVRVVIVVRAGTDVVYGEGNDHDQQTSASFKVAGRRELPERGAPVGGKPLLCYQHGLEFRPENGEGRNLCTAIASLPLKR